MPENSPFTTRFALADSAFTGPLIGAYDSWQGAEQAISDRPDARVIVTAYESDGRLPLAWRRTRPPVCGGPTAMASTRQPDESASTTCTAGSRTTGPVHSRPTWHRRTRELEL